MAEFGAVGDRERFLSPFESRDGEGWPGNFLLEDAHFIVTFEDGGPDIESVVECRAEIRTAIVGKQLSTLMTANIDIAEDFILLRALLRNCLWGSHGMNPD